MKIVVKYSRAKHSKNRPTGRLTNAYAFYHFITEFIVLFAVILLGIRRIG